MMETEIAHGAHYRRHASGDSDSTNSISHDPLISTNRIIKITIQLLKKYGLKKVVDFKVPSNTWVILQFMSNNGQQRIADRYTEQLPFVRSLQTR